jgi:hypothetical protein
MKYTGACHCKTVSFAIDAELEERLARGCSLCRKRTH